MSKEFHVFTYHQESHEQAVVFEVDRDKDNSIELGDVYLVSTTKSGEIKTKLNMQNIIGHILENKGGNVEDDSISEIIEVFDELITSEHKEEILQEIEEKRTNIETMNPNSLIIASELIAGLSPEDYPKMIEKLKKDQ